MSVKLKYLDSENEKRRNIANRYLNEIKNNKIVLPKVLSREQHVWHLFVVRTENRDDFQKYLLDNQIETVVHYPVAPHKQETLKSWNNLCYPITEQIHRTVLSLPISPVMKTEDVDKILSICNKY